MATRWRGMGRFQTTLGRAERDLADMRHAQTEAARIVASAASDRAPRRTGRLAGSITGQAVRAAATVTAAAPYAWPVISGVPSHNMAPNPFVERAAQDMQDQWVGAFDKDLQRVADSVKGA